MKLIYTLHRIVAPSHFKIRRFYIPVIIATEHEIDSSRFEDQILPDLEAELLEQFPGCIIELENYAEATIRQFALYQEEGHLVRIVEQ